MPKSKLKPKRELVKPAGSTQAASVPRRNSEPSETPPTPPPPPKKDSRWGVREILAIVAIIVSISAAGFSAWTALRIQNRREQLQSSKIAYAFMVKPAPRSEGFYNTRRYEFTIMVANAGPANARTVVLHLRTPPPSIFLHSAPEVMSDPSAAKVDVKSRLPEGNYQIVIDNLIKGDTLYLHMFYVTREDQQNEFMDAWREGGLGSADFGKRFITEFFFSGENLSTENWGALPLKPAFEREN